MFIMAKPVRRSSPIHRVSNQCLQTATGEVWRKIVHTMRWMSQRPLKANMYRDCGSVTAIAWRHIELGVLCADWLHQSRTGSFRRKLELRISRSLLQGHWCRNNILFTDFNNLKQKVCFNFSSVFKFLSILFFVSLWVRGGIAPSAVPLKPPVERKQHKTFVSVINRRRRRR